MSAETGAARSLAALIDHTLLKAETTADQIDRLCREAREHHFAAVCVNGAWTARCRALLRESGVRVATVTGFPLGAGSPAAKAFETRTAVADGADEIDMVASIGHVIEGSWELVAAEIRAVIEAASGRPVKVILETAVLEKSAAVRAATVARDAGAAFVKTSTGFHPAGGATPEAVALLRQAVGGSVGVKASGGIRDCAGALRMLAAGASRLGTSSSVRLMECLGRDPQPLARLVEAPERHRCGATS